MRSHPEEVRPSCSCRARTVTEAPPELKRRINSADLGLLASWGLMQITTEKCSDAPNGDCTEPNFNVQKGADYFKAVMVERGGNFLSALGAYNGWPSEMTWESATAFASSDCVRQNNLDYLQSNLNGWMQGVSAMIYGPQRCGADVA